MHTSLPKEDSRSVWKGSADHREPAGSTDLLVPAVSPGCRTPTSTCHRVMVHCEHGKQRSASVACAYLLWYAACDRREAVQWVQDRRRGAVIPGMWRQELEDLAELARLQRGGPAPPGDSGLSDDRYQHLRDMADRASCAAQLLHGPPSAPEVAEGPVCAPAPERARHTDEPPPAPAAFPRAASQGVERSRSLSGARQSMALLRCRSGAWGEGAAGEGAEPPGAGSSASLSEPQGGGDGPGPAPSQRPTTAAASTAAPRPATTALSVLGAVAAPAFPGSPLLPRQASSAALSGSPLDAGPCLQGMAGRRLQGFCRQLSVQISTDSLDVLADGPAPESAAPGPRAEQSPAHTDTQQPRFRPRCWEAAPGESSAAPRDSEPRAPPPEPAGAGAAPGPGPSPASAPGAVPAMGQRQASAAPLSPLAAVAASPFPTSPPHGPCSRGMAGRRLHGFCRQLSVQMSTDSLDFQS